MRRITALVDHELTWKQLSGFKHDYELRFGDDLVATLRFPKMLSSTANAESGDGIWIFERVGFPKTKTIVRAAGSESTLATFTRNVWKSRGVLEFADGRKAELKVNVWGRLLEFRSETGETLVSARSHGFFRQTVTTQMFRTALRWPELPCMVMLLFYVIIIMRRESAAHAAAH